MEDAKFYFEQGKKYFKSATSIATGKKFPYAMSVEMIALAAEYLLKSVTEKYDMYVEGTGVSDFGMALHEKNIIPSHVLKSVKLLSLGCAACSMGNDPKNQFELPLLLSRLDTINNWVIGEFDKP